MENKAPQTISMGIAKRITSIRLQRGWSRQELAKRAVINVHTLKHFERYGHISLERLIAICNALEIISEIERLFKPRQRINVDDWQIEDEPKVRRRGKRFKPTPEVPLTINTLS